MSSTASRMEGPARGARPGGTDCIKRTTCLSLNMLSATAWWRFDSVVAAAHNITTETRVTCGLSQC